MSYEDFEFESLNLLRASSFTGVFEKFYKRLFCTGVAVKDTFLETVDSGFLSVCSPNRIP